MSIRISCPQCAKTANAPDAVLGRQVRCKACGAVFVAEPEGGFPAVEVAPVVLEAIPDEDFPPVEIVPVPEVLPADEPPRRSRRDDDDYDRPRRRRDEDDDYDRPRRGRRDAYDDEPPRKPKKKRSAAGKAFAVIGLLICLSAVLGIGGLVAYLVWPESDEPIPSGQWMSFNVPDGMAIVSMPGFVVEAREANPLLQTLGEYHKYSVFSSSQPNKAFYLETVDVRQPANSWSLESVISQQRTVLNTWPGAKYQEEKPVATDQFDGRELRYSVAGNNGGTDVLLIRYFVDPRKSPGRVYILTARGPNLKIDKGDGAKFFGSFHIHKKPINTMGPGE